MNVTAGNRRIHYDAQGSGPVLLLLHAFPLSSAMWASQAEAFAATHRVVRVDARGFGGSDLGEGPLTMDHIAEDAAAVLDELGAREAVVAGLSMGGYAAFAFARRFPARLRGLVLASTKAVPDSDEARAGRATLAKKVEAEGAAAAADALLPKLLGTTTQGEKPELVQRVRRAILDARPAAISNALHGLGARPDSRPTLGLVKVPTLVVRGEEDAIASADEARQIQDGIAGGRLVTIPGAGHLPNLERPAAFDEALRVFLDAFGR
jgi:3-oxoadipate enol-lactonase